MNDTLQAIAARKSVRAFEKKAIPADIKQALLEAAFQAPTAGNMMLYTILDITDPALKEALAKSCDDQPFIAEAPLVLVFLADCRRWLDSFRAAGLEPRGPGPGNALLAAADAVIAAQNVVVAAESFGLGSCYIGDILENCEDVRGMLRLPEEVIPAAMLVIGYPIKQQKERKKPARIDGRYIVFENQYELLTPEQHEQMFLDHAARDGRLNANFAGQVAALHRWKYNSAFAREMNRSAAEYLKSFAWSDDK